MGDVHIADWQMQQPSGGADPDQLLRRQKEMMLDLYRMAPRLANLSLGELRAAWMAKADAWWVRLTLVPRTQGLLFDAFAKSRARPATLFEEAAMVRKELEALPMYAKQAAAGFKRWAARPTPTALDPVHELAYRRSKAQWVLEMETGQTWLKFPELERYKSDVEPVWVTGTLYSVSVWGMELRRIQIRTDQQRAEAAESSIASLRVLHTENGRGANKVAAWNLATDLGPGDPITVGVVLHRCVLSHRVVGAVAVGA